MLTLLLMIDLARIRKLYKLGKDLTLKDAQVLLSEAKMVSVKKREMLIEAGSSSQELYFIRKGLVRSFHVNQRGDEITFRLITESELVANTDTILYGRPSRYYYQALEDVSLFSMSYETVQRIAAQNPKLDARRKFFFQAVMRKALDRIESLVLLSPEERYEQFVQDYPDLTNRVQDKYIAHVLGITPVSLSRIRKRIASRKDNSGD